MKRTVLWVALALVLLIAGAVIARNSIQSPMIPRASEGWSRGRIVGQMEVKRPVTLRVSPTGGVFLAWPNPDGKLELAHIGIDGEVLLDRVVPVRTRKARDPQLRVGQDGRLRLLWREQEGQQAGIHYAVLEADGTPVGQPWQVSDPGTRVSETPQLVADGDGRFHTLWTDDAGVRWATVGDGGEITAGPTLLIPDGVFPMARMDDGGRLHLIWQRRVGGSTLHIHYGNLDPGTGELTVSEEIAEVVISGPLDIEDMGLGLGPDTGYIFWSEYNSKFEIYSFRYASFPLDAPDQRRIHDRALVRGAGPQYIATLDGQRSPLPVALTEMMMGSGGQVELQLTLINAGEAGVEEVVTGSTQASMRPVLIADEGSHLHMAWLETGGFGEYNVVYGSTSPEVKRNYNALTFVDVVDGALDNVFRLSTVIVSLFGSLAVWAIVPLVGLAVYHLATSEETLETDRSKVAIIAVLAIEVALTLVLPPRIGVEVRWPAVRWIVPVASAAVTTAVVLSLVRRRQENHLFGTFFLFTILNSVLQMIVFLLV